MIEIENLSCKPSFYITIGIGNSIDEGKAEDISGSRRMSAMFMSSTPLLSKKKLHIFAGGFFFNLGRNDLYSLDSIISTP